MDCKHVDALLMDYLYQELDPTQAEHLEAHLQVCTRCAGELSAYERTRATVRGLPELEPPSRIDELLLREAAKAVRLQPEPAPGFWQRVRDSLRVMVLHPAMTAAVTLVLVLGVSFYIYRSSAPPSSGPLIESTPAPVETAAAPTTEKREGELAKPASPATTVPQVGAGAEEESQRRDEKLASVEARLERDQAETRHSYGLRRQAGGRTTSARELSSSKKAIALGPPARTSAGSAQPSDDGYSKSGKGVLGDEEIYGKGRRARAAKPRPTVLAKAEPKVSTPSAEPTPAAAPPKLAEQQAEAKKAPVYKKSKSTEDLDALVAADKAGGYDERSPKGKMKLGQAGGGGGKQANVFSGQQAPVVSSAQTVKDGKALTGEQWMHQGLIAQKLGKCSQALVYYDRALALEPKLAAKLSAPVRSCAAMLNETALADAKRANRRLSGMLGLEVARRARLRQLDAESVGKAAVAQKRKAAPAKAAAKPAKANTNINKGDNAATSQ